MAEQREVELRPITPAEAGAVARFLHEHHDSRLSPEQWERSMAPTWDAPAPNRGFMLLRDGVVVGANLAFYAERTIGGEAVRFCNLAALCVLPGHRAHALRLVRALIAQRGHHFTDLSPSGNVVELDRRLGFRQLDTRSALSLNLPRPSRSGAVRVVVDLDEIDDLLDGDERTLFRDHRSALAARHLVLVRGSRRCYVMWRKVRRRRLPVFASVLHVEDPGLLVESAGVLAPHLLRAGALLTLTELRLLDGHRPPWPSVHVDGRVKMVKSRTLVPEQVDDLYSELTCVPW